MFSNNIMCFYPSGSRKSTSGFSDISCLQDVFLRLCVGLTLILQFRVKTRVALQNPTVFSPYWPVSELQPYELVGLLSR